MPKDLIVAAGGVLFRGRADGHISFASVHKAKLEEWCLPKGKCKEDETWRECALREVREETGSSPLIVSGPDETSAYLVAGVPKIVVWFTMIADGGPGIEAGNEIDDCAWLSAAEMRKRLCHPTELAVFNSIPVSYT